MDSTFWVNVAMRWLHITAAAAAVGGILLLRFAVVPALSGLPGGAELYPAIARGFKRVLHSALGLAILTGLYNYGVVAVGAIRRAREAAGGELSGPLAGYHAVMGIKMLLSFALLGAAIALLRPTDALPENRKGLLSVNVVVGLLILALAAYLRRLWTVP